MAEITQIMLFIQAGTVILCLLYGSIIDFIKREISDIPWLIMFVEGLATSIIFIVFSEDHKSTWRALGINFAAAFIIGILLFYSGVMGGADAKAIMALSVNTAVLPFNFEVTGLAVYNYVPTVFNVFFNWLLVMIVVYPLPLVAYNLYLRTKGIRLFEETSANFSDKILAIISGYVIPVEKCKNRVDIVYSEIYNESKEKWKIKHFMQVAEVEEEEKFKQEIEEWIGKTGKKRIWVKVLPPGIVFLLIGYIVTLFIANPLFALFYALG